MPPYGSESGSTISNWSSSTCYERLPATVRGVVEHPLDHAGDGDGLRPHAAAAKARSNDLGSDHQTCDMACELGSGKMSSWSAISPARIPPATSAAGVLGASIPASMSVSIPPG